MHQTELDRLLMHLSVHVETVAVCEISKGYTLQFEPYDAPVIYHVVQGSGVLEASGCRPISFDSGSMLLIPAHRRRRIRVGELPTIDVTAKDHCSIAPHASMRVEGASSAAAPDLVLVCGAVHAAFGSFNPFQRMSEPLIEDMSTLAAVRMAFETMLAEQAHPTIGAGALTAALMKQCLLLFIRQHFLRNAVSPLSLALRDERLARALTSILEHPGELCMRELAECAGMSRSAFAKRFLDATHTTPMEFVRRTRLQRAAALLESTDLPIKTIASAAGYASRSQFCRAFRTAFGVHPSKYRRLPPDPSQSAASIVSRAHASGSAASGGFIARTSE